MDNKDQINDIEITLRERTVPPMSQGFREGLHRIPQHYPQAEGFWIQMKNLMDELFLSPQPALGFAMTLVVGLWAGMEAELLLSLASEDISSYLVLSEIGEEWL